MKRAYKAGAALAAPSPTQATSLGFPREADIPGGLLATVIGPWWFYMATEESARLIEEAGLVPDNDPDTFRAAVRELVNQIIAAALARFEIPEGIELATRNEHLLADPPNDKAATPLGVRGMIERVVDSAPGALDTLNELAAALADDPNFAATVNAQIALRARLDGATFTGTLRAPTPPTGDDSTHVATTAWIQGFFGGASSREFTAAGTVNYEWEWDTPNGIAILIGGSGGPGGGGATGQAGVLGRGVRPHGADGTRGAEGEDSRLQVGGATYTGPGGRGGVEGPGGGSGFEYLNQAGERISISARNLSAWGGNGGGAGAGNGGDGELGCPATPVVQPLSGLSLGDQIVVTVGAGGAPGAGAGGDSTTASESGMTGHVILIPAF